jgi:hypothetical protein
MLFLRLFERVFLGLFPMLFLTLFATVFIMVFIVVFAMFLSPFPSVVFAGVSHAAGRPKNAMKKRTVPLRARARPQHKTQRIKITRVGYSRGNDEGKHAAFF